jgi:hypothetical protein
MTRNHEPYRLAALGKAHGSVVQQQSPLAWARSIHTQWQSGIMRPHKEPGDPEKTIATIRRTTKAELVPVAIAAVVRGENELRLRALFRAARLLAASRDAADEKPARELSMFLRSAWGVTDAAEAVAEGETSMLDDLREKWGKVQLPPSDATVNQWSADELLIAAVMRRLK